MDTLTLHMIAIIYADQVRPRKQWATILCWLLMEKSYLMGLPLHPPLWYLLFWFCCFIVVETGFPTIRGYESLFREDWTNSYSACLECCNA